MASVSKRIKRLALRAELARRGLKKINNRAWKKMKQGFAHKPAVS